MGRLVFVSGLILLLGFPPVGILLLLWVGFGDKTNNSTLNIIARITGTIGLTIMVLIAASVALFIYALSGLH